MAGLLVALLTTNITAQTKYQISLVAGKNPEGSNAIEAPLGQPQGVAADAQGNVYFVDQDNLRIRKIDASGKITTIAGTGENGFSGDGNLAVKAQVSSSVEVLAMDSSGDLYFSDGSRIRKITMATGIVTTIAGTGTAGFSGDGGLATAADINFPGGIAFDSADNLYFTGSDHRIRRIEKATGIITTYAGTGVKGAAGDGGPAIDAQFNAPQGLAFDNADNLYIAGRQDSRVRKIDGVTKIITNVAGTGAKSFGGDGGPALDAQFFLPVDVALDAAGNLYIADGNNLRIRKVDMTTGNISTFAGNGGSNFSGDGGVATAAQVSTNNLTIANGQLYLSDGNSARIRKIDLSTNIITSIAGTGVAQYLASGFSGDGGPAINAAFNNPEGLAVDATGNVYIIDKDNHRIRKVDVTKGNISTIAGTGTSGFSGDGGLATAAQLNAPAGITVDANGNVYISDGGNHRVRKIDAGTGNISTIAGVGTNAFSGDGAAATSAELNSPKGLVLDASGNLYIVDSGNYRIRKVNANTGNISTIAGTGASSSSGDGGLATAAGLISLEGIAIDNAGNIYIIQAPLLESLVRKIDATTGIITTIAGKFGFPGSSINDGGLATNGYLSRPRGVAVDASGNVYIADTFHDRIRKIDATTGNISTITGRGTNALTLVEGDATKAAINRPAGIAVDAQGNIYFSDSQNHAIRRLTLATTLELKQQTNTIATLESHAFNNTKVNATTQTDFTISNTGAIPLNVSRVTATGDFSIVSAPTRAIAGTTTTSNIITVNPGNNTSIKVAMNTNSVGAKNGTLEFRSNDLNVVTYKVKLSGLVRDDQTITFDALPAKAFGEANFQLSATGGASGNAITYTSSDANVATISGNTVTIVGAGTTTIIASQAGNTIYNAAIDVPQTLIVTKANQTVTFNALATKTFGDAAFTLSATGGASGNAITYTSSDTKVATVAGNTVTIVGAGKATITANQAGNMNYNAATNVSQTLTINKAVQTLTFDLGTNATKIVGDAAFDLMATGGASGNAITYMSSNTAVATISGNTVTIVGPGTTTITASQSGNANYEAAKDINQTLTVNQTTALAESLTNARLTLFPNPTPDVVHFRIKGQVTSTEINVTVLDRQGAVVLQSTQRLANGQMTLPINHLAAGYYLFKIKIGEEVVLRRIVKK